MTSKGFKRIRFSGSKEVMEREGALARAIRHELSGFEWYNADIIVIDDELSQTAKWIAYHIKKADEDDESSKIAVSYDGISEPDTIEFPHLDIHTSPTEYLNEIAEDLRSSGVIYLRHLESGERYYLADGRGIKDGMEDTPSIRILVPGSNEERSRKDDVLEWRKAHPNGTQLQCSKDIKASTSTVWKWWYGGYTSIRIQVKHSGNPHPRQDTNKAHSRKDDVLRWRMKYPYGSQRQCAREIGTSATTVNKWWNAE